MLTLVSHCLLIFLSVRFSYAQSVPSDARYLALQSAANVTNPQIDTVSQLAVPEGYTAAPWYPTPHGGSTPEWAASYAKAAKLVANMTLAEKTNITTGTGYFMGRCVGNTGSADRVGFPQLCLQDGPLGVRNTEGVTAFPAGITVGATWNKKLMYARGAALGEEFRGKGINIHLGPSVGALGRKPRGGRNWEGFGSDPVLQGIAARETVIGIQDQGVIATIKHWIANEQEMFRMYNPFQPGYSSNVDDRTMHELYMWPFAEAIRANVGAVMSAYNAVNGSAATQNSYLINNLLKDELGFQGFMMSDWLAQVSGVATALSGLDMTMPGDPTIPLLGDAWWAFHLTEAVLNGTVPMDRLNDMATRIVATWYKLGQDQEYPTPNFSSWSDDAEGALHPGALISPTGVINEFVDVQADHAIVARAVAAEAVTLLKNVRNTLPLVSSVSLAVFGSAADENPDGINDCADKGCNKGTLTMGWGSGSASLPYLDTPIGALRRRGGNVTEHLTDKFPSGINASEDVALVFITADSGENYITVEGNPGDRTSAGLHAWHNGDELVKKAAEAYDTVVVVVQTVGPILMEEWHDLPSVKAIVFQHLPGQEAGESLTSILYGDESPSGHLPYSITRAESDLPDSVDLVYFQFGQPQDTFSERHYIDYRYLDAHDITPRYAFGHGLSYADFSLDSATMEDVQRLTTRLPQPPAKSTTPSYNNTIPSPSEALEPAGFPRVWRYIYSWLSISDAERAYRTGQSNATSYPYPAGYINTQPNNSVPAEGGPGGNPALFETVFDINVTVSNISPPNVTGKAVVQAYVQFPNSIQERFDTPPLQLRDFDKTEILMMGDEEVLSLSLTRKDVSVWDVGSQNWIIPDVDGEYLVWLGLSSRDLRVRCSSKTFTCGPWSGPIDGSEPATS